MFAFFFLLMLVRNAMRPLNRNCNFDLTEKLDHSGRLRIIQVPMVGARQVKRKSRNIEFRYFESNRVYQSIKRQ